MSKDNAAWARRMRQLLNLKGRPADPPAPAGSALKILEGRPRSGKPIAPPPLAKTYTPKAGAGERTLQVAKKRDGRVAYTAPPLPVREITFSGGGAKGNALPGAIKALQASGVLKDAKKIAGASVGSMTAALIAAGMTAEEFDKVGNDDATTDAIVEGTGGTKLGLLLRAATNLVTTGSGNPLTGEGLETIVRKVLDDTIRTRIEEYLKQCGKDGVPEAPVVREIITRLGASGGGPTFLDLRKLSGCIPAVKEVVITGTYLKEFVLDDKGRTVPKPGGNDTGKLYVFDADSEPDLEVAVAVHASASFPMAFKPVDIQLKSGLLVRFIDGGVMNNTPTSSSLGVDRDLDPMPDKRGLTFIFEDAEGVSKGLLEGKVKPGQGYKARFVDWLVNADNSAGEYAKNRDLADRPEELVEVPLQLTLPPRKKGGKERKVDMRDGTLEFNLDKEAKIGLQNLTEQATQAQIERERQPKTREFASDAQMFCAIPLVDLQTLVDNGYAGAADALHFRSEVDAALERLRGIVKAGRASDAPAELATLELLAGAEAEFQAFVGRELNKGGLAALIDGLREQEDAQDAAQFAVLEAAYAVSDALDARAFADTILKELVYPKMTKEKKGGTAIAVLLEVERLLRVARSAKQVNAAVAMAVKHFEKKADRSIPKRGHKEFAKNMQQRFMPLK